MKVRYKASEIRYDIHMNVHKKMALLICCLLHVAVLAESSKEPKHTLLYRGMRVPNTDKLFYVTYGEYVRFEDD